MAEIGRATLTLDGDFQGFVNGMRSARSELSTFGKVAAGALAGIGVQATREAIKFESALTGVAKTVDGTTAQIAELGADIQDMSKRIPIAATELLGVAEAAGQLGIERQNIVGFTETMAALGVTTNLSANDAATALARFANVMQTSQDEFDRIGSAVVDLGNNFATTEREIVEFSTRMAGAANIAGLAESDVLAIGAAMSSVGVEAEAGGTAVQRVLIEITNAVSKGGGAVQRFADIAGMAAEDFADLWQRDAGAAFAAFVNGLGGMGQDATVVLEELGLANQRTVRAFLSLANAGDLLTDALDASSTAWDENTALAKEAEQFYNTTASQLKILANSFKAAGVELGQNFLPALKAVAQNADNLIAVITALAAGAFAKLIAQASTATVAFLDKVAASNAAQIALAKQTQATVAATAAEVAQAQAALRTGLVTTNTAAAESARAVALARLANAQKAHAAAQTAAAAATTSFAASIRGLFAAIGPTGWFIIGVTAAVGLLQKLKNAARELREEQEKLTQETKAFANALQRVPLENVPTALANMEVLAGRAADRVKELEEEIGGLTRRGATPSELAFLDEMEPKLAAAKEEARALSMQVSQLRARLAGGGESGAGGDVTVAGMALTDINRMNQAVADLKERIADLKFEGGVATAIGDTAALQDITAELKRARDELDAIQRVRNQLGETADVPILNPQSRREPGIDTGGINVPDVGPLVDGGEEANETFSELDQTIMGLADRGLNAMLDFATGSTNAFQQFAQAAVQALTRIIAKLLVMKALQAIGLPVGDIPGFADGGNMIGGQMAMVGENGPELVIPQSNSTVVPNNELPVAGGGGQAAAILAAAGPRPRAMTPDAVANDAWWRKTVGLLVEDAQRRRG